MLAVFGRDADAVIVYMDQDTIVRAQLATHHDAPVGVFERVAQQVAQRVGHCLAVKVDDEVFRQLRSVDRDLEVATEEAHGIDLVGQPLGEMDAGEVRFRRLALEAGVGQAGVDQVVELVEVGFHHCPQALALGPFVGTGKHLECEAHARDRRAQFVRNGRRQFAVRREQLLDAFGHAVHGFGERCEELGTNPGRARFEIAVTEVACGLAQRLEVTPHRAHPEPEGDREDDPDQAPGQQAQAEIEGQAFLDLGVAARGQRPDHEDLAAGAEAVVHHVAVMVDRDVAGIQLDDLSRSEYPVKGDALDDAQPIGELLVELVDFLVPGAARGAVELVLDQGDGAAHEAACVVVRDAALGSGDDEVGGEGDGDERTHRQQVEIEEKARQAVAATPPVRQGDTEQRAGETLVLRFVAGGRLSSSHAC